MRLTLMKLTTTTALSFGLLAAPALADMTWDGDSDGLISENEFHNSFGSSGAYEAWDSDGDAMISESEFSDGIDGNDEIDVSFSNWDNDSDGMLSQDEWNDGWFSLYDDDGNSEIDDLESAEITEDFDDEGIFGS